MTFRSMIAALAFGLALAAAPAQANDRTIPFEARLDLERPVACEGALFGLGFDMLSSSGAPLGTGTSCVHAMDGCEAFTPFCRLTRDATFTLDFARGSVTARMTLREVQPVEGTFIQRGKGKITSGSGDFAGARGRVDGGGPIAFTATGLDSAVFYAVRLKRR